MSKKKVDNFDKSQEVKDAFVLQLLQDNAELSAKKSIADYLLEEMVEIVDTQDREINFLYWALAALGFGVLTTTYIQLF